MNTLLQRQNSRANGSAAAGSLTREDISVAEIRARLEGQVIMSDDPDYDEARTVYYGGFDGRPALIVRVANVSDIATVISLARETGLELAVRSGGHSTSGYGVTDGGIVLDLSRMKALEIDSKKGIAWAETGLTAGEYTAAADIYGLATGFGDTGSVGIGGITLGGGIGYLVRKHGLTIDNLLGADVVTADGQLLRADAEIHADLFWAIRGGGGNFGVAARFQYRLHEVGKILGGMLILPATPEVIASFISEAESAPEELSTIAEVMPAMAIPLVSAVSHSRLILKAMMVYAGDVEAGERVISRFRSLATPIVDLVRPMRYPEMFPPEDSNYHPMELGRTLFVDKIDREVAETILHHLESTGAAMRVAELRVLGGAMARVPVDATAFAHRQRPIIVNLAASYTGLDDKATREDWLEDFAAALHQGDPDAYVNFMGNQREAKVRAIYPGPTLDRLAKIKSRYDPTNLFRLNQNILPDVSAVEQGS
jgi:FAD/FMN-containing dehydrogenase